MKPVGHIITGVQKTIDLSLTMVLLTFNGALAAADDTEPASRLLVSLTTDLLLIELTELHSEFVALVFLSFGPII